MVYSEDKYKAMITKCLICNKEFKVKPSKIKDGGGKFCSKECMGKSKMTGKNLNCIKCGKEFYVNGFRTKGIRKANYCSKNCSITDRNLSKPQDKRVPTKNCIICGRGFIAYGTNKYCCSKECKYKYQVGENSPGWKGGKMKDYSLYDRVRMCLQYREWRDFIFQRDNYTCQYCGDNKGGNLHAHHIVYFMSIMDKYNFETLDDALNCEELWNINNGLTLCRECHINIHKKNAVS